MTLSAVLGCLLIIAASVAGLLPSKRKHWPAAYALLACGVPLLGYIAYQNGPWIALVFLAAGASILRWPVVYAIRWVKGRLRPEG